MDHHSRGGSAWRATCVLYPLGPGVAVVAGHHEPGPQSLIGEMVALCAVGCELDWLLEVSSRSFAR